MRANDRPRGRQRPWILGALGGGGGLALLLASYYLLFGFPDLTGVVYPSAKITEYIIDEHQGSNIRFVTGARLDQVRAYYREFLARHQATSSEPPNLPTYRLDATWTVGAGADAVRHYLQLFLTAQPQGTEAVLSTGPWPDPQNLPIYGSAVPTRTSFSTEPPAIVQLRMQLAQAHAAQTTSPLEPSYGFMEQRIRYQVQATPATIVAFYEAHLEAAGWTVETTPAGGRTFWYNRGGPEAMVGNSGELQVQAIGNGLVEVTLTVGGSEVR